MQTIDDLKEILTAVQELGSKWREENISLREKNFRLEKENETLRENYNRLHEENKILRDEMKNLSEKTEQLKKDLSEEIIAAVAKELNAAKQDEFQNLVEDSLKDIRERLGKESTVKVEMPPSDEKDSPYYNFQ